jgi:OOP family OmpA-OmpF porin
MNPRGTLPSRPPRRAAALLLSLACGTAFAQTPTDTWYLGLFGGASIPGGVSASLGAAGGTGNLDTKPGPIAGGAVGYRLSPDWRVEAEIAYRSNTLKSVGVPGLDRNPADADLASLMFMLNGYYDFAPITTSFAVVRPYVGLGIGIAQEVDADLSLGGRPAEFSGSRAAYQLLAGVNWHYRSRWSAGLGLRYTDAGTVDMTSDRAGAPALRTRYGGLAVTAGIGYRF